MLPMLASLRTHWDQVKNMLTAVSNPRKVTSNGQEVNIDSGNGLVLNKLQAIA